MKLIDDFDNFWKFWSVRFGMLSAACSASAAAYAACSAMAPKLVDGVPQWILTALVVAAMVFAFAGVLSRGVKQSALKPDDTDSAGA